MDEPDPAFWGESAEQQSDSWWPDFVWSAEPQRQKEHAPHAGCADEAAPGSYVRER